MKLVEKNNVQLTINEDELEKYLSNGYVLYEPKKLEKPKKEEPKKEEPKKASK